MTGMRGQHEQEWGVNMVRNLQFDQTTQSSQVPFDCLTECPAALTPDETQPRIRYRLCFYRRCKRNHLLCSSSCPFEASSNGSLSFSSVRSYRNRFSLPFDPCRSPLLIFISSSTRRFANFPGRTSAEGQLICINFIHQSNSIQLLFL